MFSLNEAIIIRVEDAKKLLEAIHIDWTKEKIELLMKRNLLFTINEFSSTLKKFDVNH